MSPEPQTLIFAQAVARIQEHLDEWYKVKKEPGYHELVLEVEKLRAQVAVLEQMVVDMSAGSDH